MDQFYGTQYSHENWQQRVAQRRNPNGAQIMSTTSMIPPPPFPHDDRAMDMTGMVGGETLDDIIMQNSKEIQRRRSLQPDWRSSTMTFGPSSDNLEGFQFACPSGAVDANIRRQSTGGLRIPGYGNMGAGMNMEGLHIGFTSPMQTQPLAIDAGGFPGMSTEMAQRMVGYNSMDMTDSPTAMNNFPPTNLYHHPFNDHFIGLRPHDERVASIPENDMMADIPELQDASIVSPSTSMGMGQGMGEYSASVSVSPMKTASTFSTLEHSCLMPPTAPSTVVEELPVPKTEHEFPFHSVYAESGFDVLGALAKVASRKNPEINIGKVDLSCAFLVCDITQDDCPIIYASDIFQRLTGYTKCEILGRNCRFLQSPTGEVQIGVHRDFVDNDSVHYLSTRIAGRREAQHSLINYRKGGQPFMNLLTVIPITGEDSERIKYYVGFQIDLVEKPGAVEGRSASGMCTVDYRQALLPQYCQQPRIDINLLEGGSQMIRREDVSAALSSSLHEPISDSAAARMWGQVLLENVDDVVHVLSLKGLFLYLSPSCRQVLEYDASELVGTALSSVCHPSDIVSVIRELRDATIGVPVSTIFRIRRKESGYTWFESHGSLRVEQGKGLEFMVLVGRVRSVYALSRCDIEAAGGIGENEIWSKLSTSGMFLFVSSSVQTLLDRPPDELAGTSFQALMRAESKNSFGRCLEKARLGKRVAYRHDISNRKGAVMQVQTTLYPGDSAAGQKSSFLIAQTRILKASSRAITPSTTSRGKPTPMDSIDGHPTKEGTAHRRPAANISVDATQAGSTQVPIRRQDPTLTPQLNIFEELNVTRATNWQSELRQLEKVNRLLAEDLAALLASKKKRKRRKGAGNPHRDCANCHTRVTPEWRRGPSGQRDLCNSCGLRWAKQVNRSGSDPSQANQLAAKGRV